MATKAGVGMSRHHNPNVAGRDAAEQALNMAGIVKPDFVFMFASIGYDQRSLVHAVREITGGASLSGCSPEHALVEDRDWIPYAISLALIFEAPSYMKDEEYVVRGVPAVRMADGSITVQTEVQEGTSIWFSSRDKEKISTRFDQMAAQIKEQLGDEKPKLVFQFECLTRGKLLFREQEKQEILRRFRQSVDPEVPWAGFYTIGEIGPVEEHNDRHLYTSVVLTLS
jgi:hypothetical protein